MHRQIVSIPGSFVPHSKAQGCGMKVGWYNKARFPLALQISDVSPVVSVCNLTLAQEFFS